MKKYTILRNGKLIPCNEFDNLKKAVSRLNKLRQIFKHSQFIIQFN